MNKKFIVIFFLLSALAFNQLSAQFSLNVNIGTQHVWGPTGYDYAENYYFPEIGAYYNVADQQYTYQENNRWVTTRSLPYRYQNYDLYNGYKVVINHPRPYLHDNEYRSRYAQYRDVHNQPIIRDSRDNKYFENKDHPMHNQWKGNNHDNRNNGHDNNGKGYDKGGNGNDGHSNSEHDN
ncbi:MAG: hypothetical protein EO766_13080 [Hydrotalea sp. AMD]|uniref:hypothetical protein n=1 Tax=Hydrotalea sp. AMD TaxID=2501297 RepID=UPI0009430D82|nr:hypothetical protein [Hydrotalea sp. AMD]RWZ86923.1 MAG: hypothetical protein EO766_13080 [Hydrotalea sp. AMD]